MSAAALSQVLESFDLVIKQKIQYQPESNDQQAPGQFLKHYAPYVDTFVIKKGTKWYILYKVLSPK